MKVQGLCSHPGSHWGPSRKGPPKRGWPSFPMSLVQKNAAPSLHSPLNLCRQPRPTLGNGLDFGFNKNKNKLGCPRQSSTLTPTHPSRAPQLQKPRLSAGPTGWRAVVAMVTVQASDFGSWRGGCPGGPAWVSDTAPLFGLSSPWEVAGLRGPLVWCLPW